MDALKFLQACYKESRVERWVGDGWMLAVKLPDGAPGPAVPIDPEMSEEELAALLEEKLKDWFVAKMKEYTEDEAGNIVRAITAQVQPVQIPETFFEVLAAKLRELGLVEG